MAALGAAIGCANPPYDPFIASRDEVRQSVKVLAIAPLYVSHAVLELADAKALFEVPVVDRLEAAGFRVLDSAVWESIWATIGSDIGEIYDATTGEVDSERYEIVEEAVIRELASVHTVDTILYLSITTSRRYAVSGPDVHFCGGTAPIYWPGVWTGGPYSPATMVVEACLGLSLYDLDSRYLYGIRSALEILETYAFQKRAIRPMESRFRDDSRRTGAIDEVIGPMIENRTTTP